MPEHIVRAFYYAAIHLTFASLVSLAALALTMVRRGSATTKYWIWTATSVNFFLPLGAIADRLWAPHLRWARPLGVIGGEVNDILQNTTLATLLGVVWFVGAVLMSVRLVRRIRAERGRIREEQPGFLTQGVPVRFSADGQGPEVSGILHPKISLPNGIESVLSGPEIDAVLIHELTHAKRRDNFTRLVYEAGLCALWFHPLVWLAGSRLALYRELSCDERVIQSGYGRNLVTALTKLADPERIFLQQTSLQETTASSFLSHRLARLAAQPHPSCRALNMLTSAVFAAVFLAGVFETVAHTACCFLRKG